MENQISEDALPSLTQKLNMDMSIMKTTHQLQLLVRQSNSQKWRI
jgi:hypothetical protein